VARASKPRIEPAIRQEMLTDYVYRGHRRARHNIRSALGFPSECRPLLIGIDGIDGSGKSSAASWLSWQLKMPAVHLDLYLVRDSQPLTWRYDELSRLLEGQVVLQRPLIVEGVMLLQVLRKIRRAPDFLVGRERPT
jgi:hypothetical protein